MKRNKSSSPYTGLFNFVEKYVVPVVWLFIGFAVLYRLIAWILAKFGIILPVSIMTENHPLNLLFFLFFADLLLPFFCIGDLLMTVMLTHEW